MKHALCLLFILAFSLSAADLLAPPYSGPSMGMTEPQARAKFGEPVQSPGRMARMTAGAEKVLTFERDGFLVTVGFLGGRAGMLLYARRDGRPLTRAEAEVLVRKNGPGPWTFADLGRGSEGWESPAIAAVNSTPGACLYLTTRAYHAANARQLASALGGL